MKTRIYLFLISVVTLVFSYPSEINAQEYNWKPIGPWGTNIKRIACNDTKIFVIAFHTYYFNDDIYESTDDGNT